jgi:hypothetical protein
VQGPGDRDHAGRQPPDGEGLLTGVARGIPGAAAAVSVASSSPRMAFTIQWVRICLPPPANNGGPGNLFPLDQGGAPPSFVTSVKPLVTPSLCVTPDR